MGRSKFPGKPSRLVNKKRVSVLQTSENYPLTDNNDEDSDYLPGDHQQTTTFDNGDIQNISTPSSRKKSPSSEPPDGGGGNNTASGKNSQNSSKNDKNAAPASGVVTRARTVSSPNLFTSTSTAKATTTATSSTNSQSKTDINPSNPITNANSGNSSNSKKDKGPTEKQQPVKKKTVTFKNVLETSDDASAVKKVYNPDNAPLVPIIKKECLSRSVRLARSDCIVRPSRLTEILKNNANKIDKLNSLTFKSASHHNHQQQQQSTGGALSPSSTSSLESSSDVPSTSTSSNLQPFHQLHHPLYHHHHHSHHHHSHHSHRHSQLSSSGGSHHDFSTNSPSASTTNPLGISSTTSSSTQIAVAASSSSSSTTTASTNNKTELTINTRSDSVAVGDKRFVLPKRSAHSCRVIKPNKRFLDDTGTDVISRNNKTSTTISSSSSSAPPSTSLSSGGNGGRKQHSRRQQHQNSKENYEENEDDDDDGKKSANTGIVATKGQKQSNHHHSSSPNSGAASSNVSGSSSGSRNASGLQDSFINSTLSLKINSSKLGEGERDEEDANSEASQLATDDTQSDDEEAEDVKSNKNFSFNPFSNSKSLFNTITTTTTTQSKVILRQPRLQFGGNNIGSQLGGGGGAGLNSTTTSSSSSTNSPFSLNLMSNLSSSPLSLLNSSTCGVCGSSTTSKPLQQSRKFGIYSCESCRKFISKTIKKLAASSGVGNSQANSNLLQCVKGDGTCQIVPTHKGSTKSFKSTFKDRCTACWLKKCIKAFHVPSGLKTRLMATLPLSLRDSDNNNGGVGLGMALAPFTIKTESPSGSSSDLTASSLNLFSTPASKLLSWGDAFDSNHHLESMPTKSLSLVNPLAENNTTFGSSGSLIKPTILEKPVFMLSASTTQQQFSDKEKDNRLSGTNKTVISALSNSGKTAEQQPLQEENTNSNKVKLRRKERENIVPAVAPAANPVPSAGANPATPTIPATASEQPKRQRIDLKGPRVKHVCRSASIVLGQPIATFSNESPILDTLDTPPHAESPGNGDVDLPTVTATVTPIDGGDSEINCTSCGQAEGPDETDLGLSPPATPIERDVEEDQGNCDSNSKSESIESVSSAVTRDVPDGALASDKKSVDDLNSKSVTMTRKIASRPLTISNSSANVPGVNALGVNPRNLNAFSKRLQQHHQQVPVRNLPPTISIDFWENYDPAEVSQTGFGLIVTDSIPIRALCFLCGSAGIDPLIFCACCCEPYHQYCVEDEYNLKHSSLDDTINSILDTSINVGANMNLITNRLNWLCPRCTVCYTCNMSSGSKVKCQKCAKNYHTTCLGTSKRLLGADRPLICANCLKCKSCSTTKVTKFVGNLPMCSQCFKLRKKGNYCPLCQKCYDDNDFDLKMMECGNCKRWVHARCEGLSDEQYNMLSTLPENIEFICKFCSKVNTQANLWREAVSAEFKSGLLSVIKLLSKSRQACSLLKLSPRKKTTACTCQPIQSNRNIQFGHGSGTSGVGRKYDTYLDQVPSELGGDNEDSRNSNDTQAIDEDIYEFKDASSMAVVPTGMPTAKCFCGASQKALLPLNVPSLVDVKRKVNVNEYVSLAEFNYDMNNVITAAGCDELMIAYKEILSEAFPWFQNETKACTDALEEDMFDSCTFTQNADIDDDQQVPVIDLPDNIDDYFYTCPKEEDIRLCLFCKIQGEGISSQESRLLYCGHNSWVHINCAMWSAEVFEEIDGSLQNVHSAIARGRLIKCTLCGNRGATVGCNVKSCGEHYHYPCARKTDCAFLTDKTVYCPSHLFEADRKKATIERNFEVLRPVYVELDRKKKKLVEPSKVQFLIGSLEVKRVGKLFPKFSDSGEALIPVDFLCKRLYWSIREPWKIVEYTVKTSIQNNMVTFANDTGRNFTVDHTNNLNIVQLGLAQISRWHNSLTADIDETELILKQERTMKQFLEVVGQNYGTDETTEEEPQNNADLLPPEIKDAIFEDLPHEILDGISMLDILPKLMIYEDMIAIDSKAEGYFTNDYNKDGIMSEEDLNESSQKEFDVSTSWPISANVTHVEDAMLSGVRQLGSSREIKRSKSEVFSRGIGGNRSQQRSSSLTWSCKLDTTSAKRRKLSKRLQDIRLPEGVLLSIGRRKDDFPGALERRRTSQNDECKTKSFTWSAAKKYSQTDTNTQQHDMLTLRDDRFKISQLDGMDDLTNESDYGEYQSQVTVFDPNAVESPVKCDRCNCTYRTHDSYQRHLPQCEPLSTSESESEAAPRSPDMQSPVSHNILISQDLGNGKIQQNPISIMQNFNQASTSSVNGIPITKIQNTLIQGSSQIPIQNNSLTHASISFSNGSGLQNMQIQNIRNSSIPITQLNQGVQNIIFTSQNETSSTQQQTFTQSGSLNGVQQQFIPIQTSVGQFSSTQNIIQAKPMVSSGSHTISLSNNVLQQPGQQQIFAIPSSNGNQILTMNPQQTIITTQPAMQQKPQLIRTQTTPTKMKGLTRMPQTPPNGRMKTKPMNPTKPLQMKRTQLKHETTPKQINIINQGVPIIRTQAETPNPGIVFQQNANTQPIIVQQMNNPNNIVSYVTSDGHNQMQYVTMPSANEFKQPQPQFLTANPLVQGAFLQTDSSGNLVLTNTSSGLQMLSAPLQLAQQTQPQVIGTLIQPQANGLQCGVMSAEQMVLGTGPTLEMVTNSPMLLTSQPVYYGLETIVQNTVMSSQQFVSTAMQGVLSQNASFSATTTQVFQASKIEPIMEVPTGYVVLNNVDGTIMQQPGNQTNIISTNVLQQPIQQIHTQPQQIHAQTVQPQQINAQQIQPIYNIQQQSQPQQTHIQQQQQQQQIQVQQQQQQQHMQQQQQIHYQQQQQQQQHHQMQQQQTIPATHQTLQAHQIQQLGTTVSPQKPTAKSSPIVVTKIQPQIINKVVPSVTIATSQPQIVQETKANPIIFSKTVTIAPSLDNANNNPIIVQTAAQAPQQQTMVTQSSTPGVYQTAKIVKSNPISVSQHPLKPKTSSMSGGNSTASAVPIQPVHRKMNMIRPLSKVASVSIRPKVVSKPIAAKHVKTSLQSPPLIAPKPHTAAASNARVLQQTQNRNISVTEQNSPEKSVLQAQFNNFVTNPSNNASSVPDSSGSTVNQASNQTITMSIDTSNIPIALQNVNLDLNSAGNLIFTQQQYQQPNSNHTIASTLNPQTITLPATSGSIQLPSAPYVSQYSSGIPTNVVNPIQQISTHQQSNVVSRPTNRVLPMQTIQQKFSPPTPPEPKLAEIEIKSGDQKDFKNADDSISANVFSLEKDNLEALMQSTIDEADGIPETPETYLTDQQKDEADDELNSALEDVQGEADDDFDLKNNSNEMPDHDDISDTTTPEVKEKICEILENLEEDEDCNKSPLTADDNFNRDVQMMDEKDTLIHQKENVDPVTAAIASAACKDESPLSRSNFVNIPKPTGPRLLYEIQSEDGFTYKSTSISDIWEKVFEAVQVARKAHGLAPLPEGPLADMCGVQMLGLKTNALRYLIEQLPGVERCSKYTPKYHPKPSQIITPYAVEDQEDLKENFYAAARCEPFVKRSDYDMFSWLASRHRKQPVQVVVQTPDMELIPRRGSGSNLPMAMKYRTLKETYKDYVGVFRSHIHGRGLYCTKDIEAGEMVIEYAGELIRSTLTDKRERYYDSKGIGCYMFKIDENLVVDATMRGNAARFINHSCEPNCYSKVVDILGHKHIIIFALRRIVQGEELTYDYKFPFEEVKIPCSCESKKCRKYLN